MPEATGGVPRAGQQVSQKADQNLGCQQHCWLPSRCLKNRQPASRRVFSPRAVAGDANAGSLEPNRLLRFELNS